MATNISTAARRSGLGRKYLKFSPRKLRDTFIIGNAFLNDEMVSVNKEVTWPASVNNLDLSALVSGGKFV